MKIPRKSFSKIDITNSLNLPQDVFLGATIVTMYGNNELFIENYKGLIEYTNQRINIQGKHYSILVTGSNLVIDYFSNDDMKITGIIKSLEYK